MYIFIVSLNFKIGKTIFGECKTMIVNSYASSQMYCRKNSMHIFMLINFTKNVFSISKRSLKMSYTTKITLHFFLKWERSYTHYKNVILPSCNPSWGVGVVSIVVWATIILLNSKFHFRTYPTQHLKNFVCYLFMLAF